MPGGLKLSSTFPRLDVDLSVLSKEDANLAILLQNFIHSVVDLNIELQRVVNRNAIKYFDQNIVPTIADLSDGEMAIWKDADATGGNPTHFFVYNDDGVIVTFASEETV